MWAIIRITHHGRTFVWQEHEETLSGELDVRLGEGLPPAGSTREEVGAEKEMVAVRAGQMVSPDHRWDIRPKLRFSQKRRGGPGAGRYTKALSQLS